MEFSMDNYLAIAKLRIPTAALATCAAIAVSAACATKTYADTANSGNAGPPLAHALGSTAAISANAEPLFAKEIAVLTNQGISPTRARQAVAVQGKIAQSDLPNKLQAAMGSSYGGVWFEPATAQLHIGVTSSEVG